MDNFAIAKLLRQMAAVHEVLGENKFATRAYENAAESAERTPDPVYDLWQEDKLSTIPGFGKAIASYVDEYFRTGKIKHFAELKKRLPKAMFEILGLPHIRSKTAYKLSKELKLQPGNAVADLEIYANKGRIRQLPGFGRQSEKEILEGIIKSKNRNSSRMLISQALEVVGSIISYLKGSSLVLQADPLGSLRRFAPTVGDVDISVSTRNRKAAISYFLKYPNIKEVLWSGNNKATVVLKNGRQVDLMVELEESYGSLLQHFTGSKTHNIMLRERALKLGLSLSEHGIKEIKSGKIIRFRNEADFYNKLGLDWIPPELREGGGEVVAAASGKLPDLIDIKDIRGDLQSHTVWSDGTRTIQEMVGAAKNKGYEYFGVTDHQLGIESLGVPKVSKELSRRKRIIEHINYTDKDIRVLNGVEILIKSNGQLAYPDKLLAEFDYVIASVHTGFHMSRDENTRRIIRSLENPYITMLGHPTGRIINQREPIEADWERIFEVCCKKNKILEINSFPERLDLPDSLVKIAKKSGCRFAINTDAHSPENLDNMVYGVSVARRAWLTKEVVVNALPFAKLIKELGIKA